MLRPNRSHLRLLLLFLSVFSLTLFAQGPPVSPVQGTVPDPRWETMPYPAQVEMREGFFVVDQRLSVELTDARDPRLAHAVDRFLATLSRQTGMPLANGNGPAKLIITAS